MIIPLSTLCLIIVGIVAFLYFSLIIVLILWDESNIPPSITPIPTDLFCNGQGFNNLVAPINYVRYNDRSSALFPISLSNPSNYFNNVSSDIQKLYRVLDIKNNINGNTDNLIISPNHWAGNNFYGNFKDSTFDIINNLFCVYPYFCRIDEMGLDFCWSEGGTLTQNSFDNNPYSCSSASCCTGVVDSVELLFTADTFFNTEFSQSSSYNSNLSSTLSIRSTHPKVLSCNILDVDSLTTTCSWQFENTSTTPSLKNSTGNITIPFVKGSPYITLNIKNTNITIQPNFDFKLQLISANPNSTVYDLSNVLSSVLSSGYLIFLSAGITIKSFPNPPITLKYITFENNISGSIRIAYYQGMNGQSNIMYTTLINNYNIYPTECTISVSELTPAKIDNINNIDTLTTSYKYIWATEIFDKTLKFNTLLMYALPHHNITNISTDDQIYLNDTTNQILGIDRFILTTPSTTNLKLSDTYQYYWTLKNTLDNFPSDPFKYNNISEKSDLEKLLDICMTELDQLTTKSVIINDMVSWFQWLSSIATTLLIGINTSISLEQDKEDINKKFEQYIIYLCDNLDLIRTTRGKINDYINIVYDTTWGGIVNNANIVCQGGIDDNNYFYNSHIGQYGYLLFAYAVAGQLSGEYLPSNNKFWTNNENIALLFVRDVINPYQNDKYFPLWRNKDWYYGYSFSSGIQNSHPNGKETNTIGRIVMGYYACYMISKLLYTPLKSYKSSTSETTAKELENWSLTMLSSEINSLQQYYLFNTSTSFNIDDSFVQGTISNRYDSAYAYSINTILNDIDFPDRTAYIMVPILKPLTLMSNIYINSEWANNIIKYLPCIDNNYLDNEAFIYNIVLQVLSNPNLQDQALNLIYNKVINNDETIDVGSTWSSAYYWVLTQ
jgi:endoglucanase Acf2